MPSEHRTKKSSKRIIHCIAVCRDCAWEEGEYRTAARLAAQHVRYTGHTVSVEQGVVYSVQAC